MQLFMEKNYLDGMVYLDGMNEIFFFFKGSWLTHFKYKAFLS